MREEGGEGQTGAEAGRSACLFRRSAAPAILFPAAFRAAGVMFRKRAFFGIAMDFFNRISLSWFQDMGHRLIQWMVGTFFVWGVARELALTLAVLVAARLLTPKLRLSMVNAARHWPLIRNHRLKVVWPALRVVTFPALWLLGQSLVTAGLAAAHEPHRIGHTITALLTAWLVIRVTSTFFADRAWGRTIASIIWAIAALNILGLMDQTVRLLDSVGMDLGGTHLTLLLVIKTFLALSLLLWLAGQSSRQLEKRIQALPNLTPSARVLFIKVTKVGLVTVGIVIALHMVGIDLSAFALFSGAIGLGVGFGLQKVVSNLISGLILLLDKSIKPGDVISLADTYGWISSLGARYVSVVTRDGIEHLIPNEELITQRVQNWSFSNKRIRLRIPVGVSYDTDLRQAMALCTDAARAAPRILLDPAPVCLFVGFGDSSLNLELRCWIEDPKNGVTGAKSDVLLGIWDRFRANDIEVPFPQRDLHFRAPPPAEPCPPGAAPLQSAASAHQLRDDP
jgi:small-conductance mechanosensitive channel